MYSARTGFSERWLDIAGFISLVLFAWLIARYYLPGDIESFKDIHGYLFGRDFANIYAASCAVQQGRMEILFAQGEYQQWLESLFGAGYPPHNWSYPPHWLVLIYPVCALPYPLAYIGYMLLGAGLLALMCRRIGLSTALTGLLLLSPLALVNLWAGQNGFLTAALLMAAIHYRDKNLTLSALSMVLLTFKPHLGIFLPLLLIFERRWRLLAMTVAGVAAFVALSLLLFGVEAWDQYFSVTMPYQASVLTEKFGLFLSMMTTPFAFGRVAQLPELAGWLLQGVWSVFILGWFIRESFRPGGAHALPRTVAASCLAFPYLFNYDLLPLLAVGLLAISKTPNPANRYNLLAAWALLAAGVALTLSSNVFIVPLNFFAAFLLIKILGRPQQR